MYRFRFSAWPALFFVMLIWSCQEDARKTLEQNGIEYSSERFIQSVYEKDYETFLLFLNAGMSLEAKNRMGETPLIAAARSGDGRIVAMAIRKDAFLENRDNEGMTALCWAARRGYTEIAQQLLEAGSFVDTPDLTYKVTPLMYACFEGHFMTARRLLQAGADINKTNKDGGTALHNAAYSGVPDLVELLLVNGAKVNVQIYNGYTPLMYAIHSGNREVVAMLMEFGANANLRNAEGDTAADIARSLDLEYLIPLL